MRTKLNKRSYERGRNPPGLRPDALGIQADAAKQRLEEKRKGKAGRRQPRGREAGGGGTEDNKMYNNHGCADPDSNKRDRAPKLLEPA